MQKKYTFKVRECFVWYGYSGRTLGIYLDLFRRRRTKTWIKRCRVISYTLITALYIPEFSSGRRLVRYHRSTLYINLRNIIACFSLTHTYWRGRVIFPPFGEREVEYKTWKCQGRNADGIQFLLLVAVLKMSIEELEP